MGAWIYNLSTHKARTGLGKQVPSTPTIASDTFPLNKTLPGEKRAHLQRFKAWMYEWDIRSCSNCVYAGKRLCLRAPATKVYRELRNAGADGKGCRASGVHRMHHREGAWLDYTTEYAERRQWRDHVETSATEQLKDEGRDQRMALLPIGKSESTLVRLWESAVKGLRATGHELCKVGKGGQVWVYPDRDSQGHHLWIRDPNEELIK